MNINLDDLQKGDYIPAEELEKILDAKKDTSDFNFKMIQLKSDLLKRNLISRQIECGLKICTEDEASAYESSLSVRGLFRSKKHFDILRDPEKIDPVKLSPDAKQRHLHSINILGRIVGQVMLERKELILLARPVNSHPKLGPKEN